jgi:geranylgeranyl diphosphate synthase, type II
MCFWGIEESKRQADQLIADAKAELQTFGTKAQPLVALADYITARKN